MQASLLDVVVVERRTFLEVEFAEPLQIRARAFSDSVLALKHVVALSSGTCCQKKDVMCDDEQTSVGEEELESLCSNDFNWSTDHEDETMSVCASPNWPAPAIGHVLAQSTLHVQLANGIPNAHWDFLQCAPVLDTSSSIKVCHASRVPRRRRGAAPLKKKEQASAKSLPCESNIPEDNWTTPIFRNIPHECLRCDLTAILDEQGFEGCYDFAHVPVNFQNMEGLSYGLVNMTSNAVAQRVIEHFLDFHISAIHICQVSWSRPMQGLAAHIDRYRDSSMLHESVPSEYHPAIYANGVLIEFPKPIKHVKAPRIRHPKTSLST